MPKCLGDITQNKIFSGNVLLSFEFGASYEIKKLESVKTCVPTIIHTHFYINKSKYNLISLCIFFNMKFRSISELFHINFY